MDTESSRDTARVKGKTGAGGREVAMPVITAVAVVVASLSVVSSVLNSRINDLRGDVEQIKRDVGDLREDVAYIKGRIDEALKRPE